MSNPMEPAEHAFLPKSETTEDPMEQKKEEENLTSPQEHLEIFTIQAHSKQVGFRLDLPY